MKRILILMLLLSQYCFGFSQTKISGRVLDAVSGDPLPYVAVKSTTTPEGILTNFDGYYTLISGQTLDSLAFSYLGYTTVVKSVKIDSGKTLDVYLTPSVSGLKQVVIRPNGINRAELIMKRAQKNKKKFNPEKIEYYEFESYNKIQLAVNNVTDKFKKRKIFSAMEPLFDTISSFTDTSSERVLPVFVSETMSDYYYRKLPRRTKEIIKATRIQGVGVGDESYVSQILGSTFQQYNFYENNLYILDKDFISPLSFQASAYYYYQLIDSVQLDGIPCYQIKVDPKNEKDLVFKGMIWISAKDYALKQLNLEITKEANLNFVEKLKIQQEFEEVEATYWLPKKTRILIDIAEVTNNTAGMIGLYYSSSKNLKVNKVHELPFYEEKVTVNSSAFKQSDSYWDTARHEQISDQDKRIYAMVDSLKNQPLVKTYIDIVEIAVEGHLPAGKIELGPYHYLVGFNNLEGFRTRLGFRTSPEFSKDFVFETYGAYGFRDQQFKYGVFADYVFSRSKWTKAGIYVKNDIELIGITDEDIGTSALFNAFATLGTDQLNRGFSKRVWLEKELFKGYTQMFSFTQKDFIFEPIGDFSFGYYSNPQDTSAGIVSDYSTTTLSLKGRYSRKQQFLYRRNKRYNMGNLKAPVLSLSYEKSFDNLLKGDFNYQRLGAELWQWNSLGNLGTFEYTIKAYTTIGAAPYPSLFVMRGNESFLSNKLSYNLMNFFEFTADQYVSLDYEHQFNGLLLNRVPLLKHLKWRSFANTKMVYGTMSEKNRALMPLTSNSVTNPSFFTSYKPYVEMGYGVENIFRFIRVDFIHRLTYLNPEGYDVNPFGVKFNAVFRF